MRGKQPETLGGYQLFCKFAFLQFELHGLIKNFTWTFLITFDVQPRLRCMQYVAIFMAI